MFTVKAKKHDVTVSPVFVALIADRLWRRPEAQRAHAVEGAKRRLAGKFPHKKDAAILVAMGAATET
jgi:hypothetical protein